MSKFTTKDSIPLYDGKLLKLQHQSEVTKTPMDVNIYLPPQYENEDKLPVIMFLAGLSCSPQNPSEKANVQYYAAKNGFAVIYPDTSPRGAGIEGEDNDWEFGTAAGMYVDATQEPWSKNYNMYSYIMKELLPLVDTEFTKLQAIDNISITGHSMGGYGALLFYLRNPGFFKSCSAFAPICKSSVVPWGLRCYGHYLGPDKSTWLQYDPAYLVKDYPLQSENEQILISMGTNDWYDLEQNQLRPYEFIDATKGAPLEGHIDLHLPKDYDHSYYFVATFMEKHVDFHLKYLKPDSKL